jgi:hypothetical protein
VEFGAQLGVRALHGRAVIDDSLSGEHADKAGTVGLPTLGAHVTATLFTYVRAEVEVLGLAFSYGDWSMHYFEASAEIVAPAAPVALRRRGLQGRGTSHFKQMWIEDVRPRRPACPGLLPHFWSALLRPSR